MDTDFTKVKFTIPRGCVSRNGTSFSDEVWTKIMSEIKNTPIVNNIDSSSSIIGICGDGNITEDGLEVEGLLWNRYIYVLPRLSYSLGTETVKIISLDIGKQ